MTRLTPIHSDDAATATAPDGSLVRLLAMTANASMARFELAPGKISRAVRHKRVDELWYFVSGNGQMWRSLCDEESTVRVGIGLSLAIPVGTSFQFRADPESTLIAVGVTVPSWPGDDEAELVAGIWDET